MVRYGFGLAMGGSMFLFVAWMVIEGLSIYLRHGDTFFLATMSIMAVYAGIMGLFMMRMDLKAMPFRVYERGFTTTSVPFLWGLVGRERLVPWDRLEYVEVKSNVASEMANRYIEIEYRGKKGQEKEVLSNQDVKDPLAVLMALYRTAPDKLDKGVYRYIGREGEEPVVDVPLARTRMTRMQRWMSVVMGLGFGLFIAVGFGSSMLAHFLEGGDVFWIDAPLVPGFIIFMLMIGAFAARMGYERLVESEARLEHGALVLPRDRVTGLFLRHREAVPLTEVTEARRALDGLHYYHKARLVTTGGRTLDVGHGVFEELERHPAFERHGAVLRNRRATSGDGGPILELDFVKLIAMAVALLMVATASAVAALRMETEEEVAPEDGAPSEMYDWFMLVLMAVYMAFLLAIFVPRARRTRLAKDMLASDRGIHLPHAPARWRFVPSEEVERLWVKRWEFSYIIVLEAGGRRITLPLATHDKLREGGFRIEDEHGVLPVSRVHTPR